MNIITITIIIALAFGQEETPSFPSYTQQCADDAGPPWMDDLDTFGANKYYWSDSFARAVLNTDGSCPDAIKGACESRTNPLQAYLEGPISCSSGGWFCRILPDPNHGAAGELYGDFNFMHCDQEITEETFTDVSGHCHGSSDPTTFYWWVRDHWHRGYSGRLKCCCDWPPRGIANRCDYRAMIPEGMADQCRDANEEHNGPGSGFLYGFEEGCPSRNYQEPDDSTCWEVLNFGPPDEGDNDATITAQSTGPAQGAGSATGGSADGTGVFSGPDAGSYTGSGTGGSADTTETSGDSDNATTTESVDSDNTDAEGSSFALGILMPLLAFLSI